MSFKDRVEDRLREMEQDDAAGNTNRTRRAYQREYEGYTEYREIKENGKKGKIRREYTGNLYVPKISHEMNQMRKTLYLVAYLCTIVACLLAASVPVHSNAMTVSAIIQSLIIIFLFWGGASLFNCLTAGDKIKIPEYKRGSRNLKRAFLISGILLTIMGGISAVYGLYSGESKCLQTTAGFLVGALLQIGVSVVEWRIPYEIIKGKDADDI